MPVKKKFIVRRIFKLVIGGDICNLRTGSQWTRVAALVRRRVKNMVHLQQNTKKQYESHQLQNKKSFDFVF